MAYSWLQKNLITFLDLAGNTNECEWSFITGKVPTISELQQQTEEGKKIVICFSRFEILLYWFTLCKLLIYKRHLFTQTVFLINDDRLLKFVYADDSKTYRTLRKLHNTTPVFLDSKKSHHTNFIEMLVYFVPLTLRASQHYILVTTKITVDSYMPPELANLNNMFFSSPEKKVLIATYETLRSGNGQIFKTTSNVDYEAVMEKEYDFALTISKLCSHSALLPEVIGKIEVNGKTFYHEKYVAGCTLTRILKRPDVYRNSTTGRVCIDHLDKWYREYRTMFAGPKQSLNDLYSPIFDGFYEFFSANSEQCLLAKKVHCVFERLHNSHPGLVPVIAHNDLWPANILVTAKGFVVIDWERATPNRSELFDYFWMIISATMEYLSAPNGFADFSRWFECLLTSNDAVCIHARSKLAAYLELNGIASDYLDLFIALFLMEFAIRGGLSLSNQIHVDTLAAEEFRCFVNRSHCFSANSVSIEVGEKQS